MLGSDTPHGGSLEYLTPTRQALIMAIKALGEATTDQLARETYLSPGAVRQHLLSLETQGLVTFTKVREGPGRPRHVFRLTPRGESLFPQQYADIAVALITAIRSESPELLQRVLSRVVDGQVELAELHLAANPHHGRLASVLELLERYGYFPRLEIAEGGTARIVLRHCPLLRLAVDVPEVCDAECAVLRAVLPGMTITRTEHRLAGDPLCTYEASPEE
ncbi:MAG: TrmB family transcriptional regulator [Tepidiforma sp.]|nr:MAG: TrmB family transcriptional regulator [Tepidiforma sp.]